MIESGATLGPGASATVKFTGIFKVLFAPAISMVPLIGPGRSPFGSIFTVMAAGAEPNDGVIVIQLAVLLAVNVLGAFAVI